MNILNFSHPLTETQRADIERVTGEPVGDVVAVRVQFDVELPFGEQVAALIRGIEIDTSAAWLVMPPALSAIAVMVMPRLTEMLGYTPGIVRLKSVAGVVGTTFELAEIIWADDSRRPTPPAEEAPAEEAPAEEAPAEEAPAVAGPFWVWAAYNSAGKPGWVVAGEAGSAHPSDIHGPFLKWADAQQFFDERFPNRGAWPFRFAGEVGEKVAAEKAAAEKAAAEKAAAERRAMAVVHELWAEMPVRGSIHHAESLDDIRDAVVKRCIVEGVRRNHGESFIVSGPYSPEEQEERNAAIAARNRARGFGPGRIWDGDTLAAWVEVEVEVTRPASNPFGVTQYGLKSLRLYVADGYADKIVFVGDDEIWEV